MRTSTLAFVAALTFTATAASAMEVAQMGGAAADAWQAPTPGSACAAEPLAGSPSEWVALEACILADGTGSRLILEGEAASTDDCQQVYELGLVSTGQRTGLVPVLRIAEIGGAHRLVSTSSDSPAADAALFWAPSVDAEDAETVYGYEAGTGGWGYTAGAFVGWQDYGFVREEAVFSVCR